MHSTLRSPTRLLLAALALGALADLLFYGRHLGISAPLFVGLGLATLGWLARAEGRPPTRANLWLGGAALLFALLLALREDPTLTFLNLCATAGLLLLLAAGFRAEPLTRLSGGATLASALVAAVEVTFVPAPLAAHGAAQLVASSDRARALMPVSRGLLIAAPALLTFTGLLAMADSVFASYVAAALSLQLPFDLGAALRHTLFAGAAAWACAGGMLVALRGAPAGPPSPAGAEVPAEGVTQRLAAAAIPWRPLGAVESLTVLLAVDTLFGGFMLIQAAYLFGGLDTLDRTGMTYAEYARRGFFELLTVAVLALGMLLGLAGLTRRGGRERLAFNAACGAMVALLLGLLASAFQRMLLYQAAYGFTHLRIYTLSFMVWLGLVLLLFLAALLRNEPRVFTFGGLVSALVYLAALNLANPDALIVRENVARYQAGGELDASYLAELSADGTPELVAELPTLGGPEREIVAEALERKRRYLKRVAQESGWPGFHIGRLYARNALACTMPNARCGIVAPSGDTIGDNGTY
ncbi:MAG TPA: DUF4173 domain-containing protein [Roseiflexaceae bacterium]|nr:DUF4173 domain-containing protein [Roseiflexaceae bacterium]